MALGNVLKGIGLSAGGMAQGIEAGMRLNMAKKQLALQERQMGIQEQQNMLKQINGLKKSYNTNLKDTLDMLTTTIENTNNSMKDIEPLIEIHKQNFIRQAQQLNQIGGGVDEKQISASFDSLKNLSTAKEIRELDIEDKKKESQITAEEQIKKTVYDAIDRESGKRITARRIPDSGGGYKFVDQSGSRVLSEDKYIIQPQRTQQEVGKPGEFNLQKSTQSKLEQLTIKGETTEQVLMDAIKKVKSNPEAVGFFGRKREEWAAIGGMLRDLDLPVISRVGEGIKSFFEGGGQITSTRTALGLVQGRLIPAITGDTSGRYSDADMIRVDNISKAMKDVTDSTQVAEALEEILAIHRKDMANQKKFLGWDEGLKPGMYNGLFIIENRDQLEMLSPGDMYYTRSSAQSGGKPSVVR